MDGREMEGQRNGVVVTATTLYGQQSHSHDIG
jgi:hypothetical protein